jgi:hypothetical protein
MNVLARSATIVARRSLSANAPILATTRLATFYAESHEYITVKHTVVCRRCCDKC